MTFRVNLGLAFFTMLVMLVPAGKISVLEVGGRTPDLFYVDLAMFVAFVMTGALSLAVIRLWKSKARLLLVFAGVVLVGGMYSADFVSFVGALRPVLYALVIFSLVGRFIKSERAVYRILAALSLGVSLITLEILFKLSSSQLFGYAISKSAIELDWGRSNYFATFSLVSIFVSYGLFRSATYFYERLIGVWGTISALVLLYLSMSRAAALAFLVTAALIAPLFLSGKPKSKKRKLPSRLLMLFWASLGVGLVALVYPYVLVGLGYDPTMFIDSGNLRRFDAWFSALRAFVANPILGIGWSNTTVLLNVITETGTTTHSLPLQLLAETGLIGFASVLILIIRAMKHDGPAPNMTLNFQVRNGMRLGLISSLLHCLVEPSFWGIQFSVLFWTVLALLHFSSGRAWLPQVEAAKNMMIEPAGNNPFEIERPPMIGV